MSSYEPGTRIAAVRDANETTVFLYGVGVYAGDFPRPGSGNWPEETRQMARRAIEGRDDHVDEVRAADDAWMVRKLAEAVEAGKRTQAEADHDLAEYRRIRAEREARRAAMTVEEQVVELLTEMDLNPRLDLDGGGTVWGCECWWMPEDKLPEFVGTKTVEYVPEPVRSGS